MAGKSLVKVPKPTPPLTSTEQKQLAECEATIERNAQGFVELGRAMATIRDGIGHGPLYRDTANPDRTFEQYCLERWGYARSYSNNIIQASKLATSVEATVKIPNEATARELAWLLDQPKVLEKVAKRLANAPAVNATTAKAIVRELIPGAKPGKPAPESDASVYADLLEALRVARYALGELRLRGYKTAAIDKNRVALAKQIDALGKAIKS